jgi:23S rRNA (uridine2552-2'-O)-methyltransferase
MVKSSSSRDWIQTHKADSYYKKAKKEGYRARSAYKLEQLSKKYKLIKAGNKVIDLGSAPGSWLQILQELVGEKGIVIGVDLKGIKPIEGVNFIKGDMLQNKTLKRVMAATEGEPFDVVCSDMSPDISGHYSMDQARSVHLCEMALELAEKVLRHDGNLIMKIFQGEDFPEFLAKVKPRFKSVNCHTPPASRKISSETYIVAKKFRGGKLKKTESQNTAEADRDQ